MVVVSWGTVVFAVGVTSVVIVVVDVSVVMVPRATVVVEASVSMMVVS